MNVRKNYQRRSAGIRSGDTLSMRENELMDAWANATPEFLSACNGLNIKPDIGRKQSTTAVSADEHVLRETVSINDWHESQNKMRCNVEHETISRADLQESVLRILYILCAARHPKLRMTADCLIAIINKSNYSCQAAIARKYNVSRAAISKRMRSMRQGEFLGDLEMYYFGGRPEVSAAARIRANRVHKEQNIHKIKCKLKPSPFQLARLRA